MFRIFLKKSLSQISSLCSVLLFIRKELVSHSAFRKIEHGSIIQLFCPGSQYYLFFFSNKCNCTSLAVGAIRILVEQETITDAQFEELGQMKTFLHSAASGRGPAGAMTSSAGGERSECSSRGWVTRVAGSM